MSIRERFNRPAPAPETKVRPKQAKAKQVDARRWWSTFTRFIDEHMATLSPAAGAVWLVLFRNSRDYVASESNEQLAATTGLSSRHVRRCIVELVEAGVIRIEKRGSKQAGPSRYRLIPTGHPRPVETADSPDSQQDTYVRLGPIPTGHPCPTPTGHPCPTPHENKARTLDADASRPLKACRNGATA